MCPTSKSDGGVRRGKAAFFSGCKSHPVTIAPAGSKRERKGPLLVEADIEEIGKTEFCNRIGGKADFDFGPLEVCFWLRVLKKSGPTNFVQLSFL